MSMVAIGVTGAVVAAGGAAYSAYSSQQAQKKNAALAAKGAGSVPEAARYKPVDFNNAQIEQIWQNLNTAPHAANLSRVTNRSIDDDAMRRISRLVPGFKQAMRQYGSNANQLLTGQLPFSDALGVLGDSTSRTNSIGIPGTGGPASLRDLGLSELQAMQTGGGMLKDMVGIAEAVNPVSRRMTPQSQYVSPLERIQLEMQQNQLIQQSDQSANNLDATGDPRARAVAALGPQISTGQIVGNAVSALGSGVAGAASMGSGGAGGGAGSPTTPNAGGFYNTQAGAQTAYGSGAQVAYYNNGNPGGNAGWYLQQYTGGK